jgi:deoxyribodipyrimidine photo-lyase
MYHRHRLGVQHRFITELGWREYAQHLHQHMGLEGLSQSLREGLLPEAAYSHEVPQDVREARSGVPVVDMAVKMLYEWGYLHNQVRMWLASYLVHIRKVHWRVGAQWMYSHLIDGDMASNLLNWQRVAGTFGEDAFLFNAESIEPMAPSPWHSRSTAIDTSMEVIDILARSEARISQASSDNLAWHEPAISSQPPPEYEVQAPDAASVAGKKVWLVHPWHLADLPQDLPSDIVPVGVLWSEMLQAYPWNEHRWSFVMQRMNAITHVCWAGSEIEVMRALAQATQVLVVDHLCVPQNLGDNVIRLPKPGLFRQVETLQSTYAKWWIQVNRQVRHLQQLVYPIQRSVR